MVFTLPNIPKEWLVAMLLIAMIVLAMLGIDSWTHATLGAITGYILGKDIGIVRGQNETLQSNTK